MGGCRGGGSRRGARSLREGAWIPVSAHENDEGCAPDGGAGSVSRHVFVPPSSILPPWWRRPAGSGRSLREGAWIPVSGHGNDGGGHPWRGRVPCPDTYSFPPPPQSSSRGGGGHTAAGGLSARGRGFPCLRTRMTKAARPMAGRIPCPGTYSFPPSSILPPWWRRPDGSGRQFAQGGGGGQTAADVVELTRQARDRYCRRKAGLRAWTGDHDDIDSTGTRTRT